MKDEDNALITQRMYALLIVIITLLMLNNLEHSTGVYYHISKKQLSKIFGWQYADWVQSLIVIVVLDLCVIAWIRLKRYWEAGVFEFLILLLNLLYYDWPGVFEENINRRIAELIFSGMFTYGITSFAYVIAKTKMSKGIQKNAKNQKQQIGISEEEYNLVCKERDEYKVKVIELEGALSLANELLNHNFQNSSSKGKINGCGIKEKVNPQIEIFK